MKRIIILALAIVASLAAQQAANTYVAADTETLSSSATALTVQKAASTSGNVAVAISAVYVACSSCTVTVSRSGTAASTTAITPAPTSSATAAAQAGAYKNSNVGTGTTLGTYSVSGWLTIPQTTILPRAAADNFTVAIASTSGAVSLIVQWTEN